MYICALFDSLVIVGSISTGSLSAGLSVKFTEPIAVELDENLIRKHYSYHLTSHSESDLIVGET